LPPASRFRVEWENVDGEIKPLEIAGQDAQSVSVVIPVAQLARGQYALNIFVIKPDGTEVPVNGSYFFNVG
jgi:methionine-rich copper-binding protein CopC